jgi:hypothetical protein
MASTANSIGAALTTSAADIITVPAGKVYHILGITVPNVDGTNAVDVTVQWTDASASDAVRRLAYLVTVAAKDSRSCLVAPLALAAGDKVQALASASGDAEITVTYYVEDAA